MRRGSGVRRLWAIIGAVVGAMMVIGPALAVAPYPDPPPEFTDPDDPLAEMFSPRGGTTDRPMLVIFAEFNDLTFDDTDPADIDAGTLHERFFGTYPSVADYFDTISNGELQLTPAQETDDANDGAVNDGIVSVSIDEDKSDFLENGRTAEQAILLEAADEFVDFSDFDVDNSGHLTQDELIFVRQDVDEDPVPVGSATARRPDPVTLDGVDIGSNDKDTFSTDVMLGIDSGTDTNLITIMHEIGHAAWDMPDTYFDGFDTGRFDLSAGTSNLGDDEFFHTSAWQAMHLGWVEPTVVTESGYYEVPRSPVGSSFILYDPDKGTDDFMMVENRARQSNTYESGAADTGLVVWRLDEDEYHPTGGGDPFMAYTRAPDGSAAWDPSLDPNDSERTIDGMSWLDGTSTDLAIRAISPAGDTMRVYFDVRGPGILVDPITHVSGGFPFVQDVTPDEPNTIRVPVMNTGESTDTFSVSFTDLPSGWTTNADEIELEAGEEADAFPELIPAPDAATGEHQISVVGESTGDASIRSEAPLTVNVVLDLTDIEYTGETYVPIGEPAGFATRVTNASDGDAPIEGVEVTFELDGPGGTLTASGTTGSDGVATAGPIIDLEPGDYDLSASTERFGKHAPSFTSTTYRIPTAEERVADLQDAVSDAGLKNGIENSLLTKLEKALKHLEADRTKPACNTLGAFANHVSAQSGKHIPESEAQEFLDDVQGIRDQIEC